MYSISKVNPATLKQAGVDLVIISNGSHKMTKAYRRIFRMPFALYVDPSLRVYHALGMTLRTLDGGSESERGQYVQHGTVGGIAMVVGHAAKVGMPVWEKGGDIQQLGGEFVLGPG
jgi:peroxiredoxin